MKAPSSPASLLSCLATAACLLVSFQNAKADDPYRVETHGPRIGTRILLFFKDLAYGDNPNDRYERLPSNGQQAMPQPPAYGARQQRYSLDEPPPVNSMPPQRPAQFAQEPSVGGPRNMADRDTPYTSADAAPSPPRERDAQHAEVGSREENLPPAKLKKTAPTQKPLLSSKPVVQEKPAKPLPPKEPAHADESSKGTQTVSNTSIPTKKSWQAFSGDAGKSKQTSTEAPPENKTVTPTPVSSHAATLTGSKTTKEGRVKSPYAPFNELDVTGLPAGSLAMDPTTGKVFRVP
jgi:hypothetical protein